MAFVVSYSNNYGLSFWRGSTTGGAKASVPGLETQIVQKTMQHASSQLSLHRSWLDGASQSNFWLLCATRLPQERCTHWLYSRAIKKRFMARYLSLRQGTSNTVAGAVADPLSLFLLGRQNERNLSYLFRRRGECTSQLPIGSVVHSIRKISDYAGLPTKVDQEVLVKVQANHETFRPIACLKDNKARKKVLMNAPLRRRDRPCSKMRALQEVACGFGRGQAR